MCMLSACLGLKILWPAELPNIWQKILCYVPRLLLPASHHSLLSRDHHSWEHGNVLKIQLIFLYCQWGESSLKFHPNDWFAGVTTGWRSDITETFILFVLTLNKLKNFICAASQLSLYKRAASVTGDELISNNLLFPNIFFLLICLTPHWSQFHLPAFQFPL